MHWHILMYTRTRLYHIISYITVVKQIRGIVLHPTGNDNSLVHVLVNTLGESDRKSNSQRYAKINNERKKKYAMRMNDRRNGV